MSSYYRTDYTILYKKQARPRYHASTGKTPSAEASNHRKSCLKCDIRILTLRNWEKMCVILRCKLATHNE